MFGVFVLTPDLPLPLIPADIIRVYQTKKLWEDHKMTVVPVFRDRISEAFENQVVAT